MGPHERSSIAESVGDPDARGIEVGKFDAVLRWTAIGAAIGAALALLGGFAGSTPPAPEADQGPLGGILATGWWGGIVGASLGAVVGYNRSSKRE